MLARICFIKESQKYPDPFRARHALRAANLLFPNWDEEFAQELVADFGLPLGRRIKKLSRGMLSTLGVIIGLASRAPLTLFDEPYLGLDASSRHLFYDRLLADYAEHPRTIVLSTHLIDEVSDLIEHVLLIDRGRIVLDEEADGLRGQVVTVTGPADAMDELTTAGGELCRQRMGGLVRATIRAPRGSAVRSRAQSLGLSLEPVSLQDLVVRLTASPGRKTVNSAAGVGTAAKETSR